MEEVRLGSRTLQPRRQLVADGERLPLGRRALDILSALADAKGGIVTKDELFAAVWPGVVVEENALQVHIVALRKALGPDADRLKTIRGVGYQLDIDGAVDPGPALGALARADARLAHLPDRDGDGAAPEASASSLSLPTGEVALRPTRPIAAARRKLATSRMSLIAAVVLLALLAAWAVAEFRPGARERIPVVVRPLTASGTGDRSEAALASGITDELIVRLRRVPELRIGSAGRDGEAAGDAFKRAYVVDGDIRSTGDRLRVTARLLNHDGEILWSQTFDRGMVDLFDMQEQIAAAISKALSVSFEVGADSAKSGGTNDPQAYAYYMQFAAHQMDTDQSIPVSFLQRALAIDPHYVKALAQLSVSYGLQANYATTRRQALTLMAKMDASTARAIAANPNLWIGHMARGWYYANRRDFPSLERSFRRVAALDDGRDPEQRGVLAAYALNIGRTRKAISLLDSNALSDPAEGDDGSRVWALTNLGQEKEAIALFEKLARHDPTSVQQFAVHAFWAHLLIGGESDAVRFAARQDIGLGADLLAFKAETSLPTMSAAELRLWADRRFGDGGHVPLASDALYAAYYGHRKLAIALLRLAFERIGGFGVIVLWNPALKEVRKTDEFAQLVTDLGLAKMWRDSGDWGDYCRPVSTDQITCD